MTFVQAYCPIAHLLKDRTDCGSVFVGHVLGYMKEINIVKFTRALQKDVAKFKVVRAQLKEYILQIRKRCDLRLEVVLSSNNINQIYEKYIQRQYINVRRRERMEKLF